MSKMKRTDGEDGIYRLWRRRWYWPFWTFVCFENAYGNRLTEVDVKRIRDAKKAAANRTVRGFSEVVKKDKIKANIAAAAPKKKEPTFVSNAERRRYDSSVQRKRDVDPPQSNDGLLTGIVIGSLLNSGGHSSSPSAPLPADPGPSYDGGGGSFGGGGSSGSWESSSSSSDSSSFSSSSSDSGGSFSSGGGSD